MKPNEVFDLGKFMSKFCEKGDELTLNRKPTASAVG